MTAFSKNVSSISLRGCHNSRMHARIVITANQNLTDLMVTCDSNCVDVWAMPQWYQSGVGISYQGNSARYLKTELLVKDPQLIQTDTITEITKLKDTSDTLHTITGESATLPSDLEIEDATTLQEAIVDSGDELEYWLTITDIPKSNFSATVTITAAGETQTAPLTIEVPLWSLNEANLLIAMYYHSCLSGGALPSLDEENYISSERMQAELALMYDLGIKYPTWYYESALNGEKELRDQAGFVTDKVFTTVNRTDSGDEATLRLRVQQCLARWPGADPYLYGAEEVGQESQIPRWNIVHEEGGKVWNAVYIKHITKTVTDTLDTVIIAPTSSFPSVIPHHSVITGFYGAPHMGQDSYSFVFRRNYGWVAWAYGYTAIFPSAFREFTAGEHYWLDWHAGDPDPDYRPLVGAYPTSNGVLATKQIEHVGDAITDLRYIATLEAAITVASASTAKTAAEAWIVATKAIVWQDLVLDSDMDVLRNECIDHINAIIKVSIVPSNIVYV